MTQEPVSALQELLAVLGLHSPALFALSVLLLNATPGVDLLFVAGRTLASGWHQGLAAAAGISAGCVVHALLAAFGLAALLAVSPWAFTALKLVGAAYLLWLGWGLLAEGWKGPSATSTVAASAGLGTPASAEPATDHQANQGNQATLPAVSGQVAENAAATWRTFRQGLLTNVLNPKVALFFLAFLPQFIQPAASHKTVAFLVLGAWFVLQSALFLLALVALCTRLRRLGSSSALGRWLSGLSGLLFIGLAARLALSEAPT